jgi:hypothetical protein
LLLALAGTGVLKQGSVRTDFSCSEKFSFSGSGGKTIAGNGAAYSELESSTKCDNHSRLAKSSV